MKKQLNIPIEKQRLFIKQYEAEKEKYDRFAGLLQTILEKAVGQLGFLAIVQARAKKVVSFSNKIILKDKYSDPLNEVTDLCGARVIVQFQSQIPVLCELIKKSFKIDEPNSLDHKSKLQVNEFGYRSVHYIVSPDKESILGIQIAEDLRRLKGEIQVRTLAEHIWADISHDRLYKTELTIPEEWRREAARLSAILENADNTFGSMAKAVDSVSNVYEIQYEIHKAEINIEKLKILADIMKDEPEEGIPNVMHLISVYNALNLPEESKSLIKEWIGITEDNPPGQARLKFELAMLGLASCFENTGSIEYRKLSGEAKENLESLYAMYLSNQVPSGRELSFLFYRYGRLLQSDPQEHNEALDATKKALELMPDNPFYLTALTGCIVMQNIELAHHTITLYRNFLEKNVIDIERLIDLGVDAIPAWFSVGRCHFFLGNRVKCIRAYSNAVSMILNKKYTTRCFVVKEEIAHIDHLSRFDEKLAAQIHLYLNMAMSVSDIVKDHGEYNRVLKNNHLRKDAITKPIVIIAGGASLMDKKEVESYSVYIKELMYDFSGTFISGGTGEGIPGLTGRIKHEMEKEGPPGFELLAYLPGVLPDDASISPGYDHIYRTASEEFSALDILTSWTDIILSGICPSEVMVVGINGGEIADLEYRIALSLGAKVCLIAYSGRAVFDIVREKHWKDHPALIVVPNDPLTLWAIVNQNKASSFTGEEIEIIAPFVHEFYREKRLKNFKTTETDINKYKVIMRWEKLDPALQQSNRRQVAFYEHILKRVNLGIRKVEKPDLFNMKDPDQLVADDRDMLARLEHARWNAERLLEGWRYGPAKDLDKKLNPYLLAWDQLDDDIKPYDYDPVDNIPVMLQKIGYEVYQIKKGNN
ncbi:MAG: RyR domain-containing protein [Bacteroidales bacterium]|nr:RyR domain-containing protein [Bacteroidales bacterium]